MKFLLFIALGLFTQLTYSQEAYENPVDGKTYIADWTTYQPQGGVVEQRGRVINAGVRLLSSEMEFEANTTSEELVKLIKHIQELLTTESEKYSEGGEILLQIALRKESKPEFKISYQGDLKQELLQRFYDALASVVLKTRQSTVTLQVHFIVKKT